MERARTYLARLTAGELHAAGAMMDRQIVFEDPTADAINGVGVRIRGRDDVLAAFEGTGDSGSTRPDVTGRPEVVGSFAAGRRVVMHLELHAETRIAAPSGHGPPIRATTVLEFSPAGSIVHHLDLADYGALLDLSVATDVAS